MLTHEMPDTVDADGPAPTIAVPESAGVAAGADAGGPTVTIPRASYNEHLRRYNAAIDEHLRRYNAAIDECHEWRTLVEEFLQPYLPCGMQSGADGPLTPAAARDELVLHAGDRPSIVQLLNTHQRTALVYTELRHAESKYPGLYHSTAEGLGVIEREMIEVREADQARDLPKLAREALQVAACCVRLHEFVCEKMVRDPDGNQHAPLPRAR